jgi:hypothetical protein
MRLLQAAPAKTVDVLSVCNVATGTPVAVEILSRLAARDATVPNTRMNAAMITVNPFIRIASFRIKVSVLARALVHLCIRNICRM